MDNQSFRKVFVEVEIRISPEGEVRPLRLKLEDQTFEIDRLKQKTRAHATRVGGTGIRYTVVICGTETFLFEYEGRWFVEAKCTQ